MASCFGALAKWWLLFRILTVDVGVSSLSPVASDQGHGSSDDGDATNDCNGEAVEHENIRESDESEEPDGESPTYGVLGCRLREGVEPCNEGHVRRAGPSCCMCLCGCFLCYLTMGACCLNVNSGDSPKAKENENTPPHSDSIAMTISAMIRAEDNSIAKHIELKIPFATQQNRLDFLQWLSERIKLCNQNVVGAGQRFQLEIVLDLDREEFVGEEKQLVNDITESTSVRTTFAEATSLVLAVVEYRNDLFLGNSIDDARKREYYKASDLEQMLDSIPDEKLKVLQSTTSTATSSSVPSEAVTAANGQGNTANFSEKKLDIRVFTGATPENLPEPKLIREALPVLLGLEGQSKSSNRELRGPGILKTWGLIGGWFEVLGYREKDCKVEKEEGSAVLPSWDRAFGKRDWLGASAELRFLQEGAKISGDELWVAGVVEGMFGFLRDCRSELEYNTIGEGFLYALGFGKSAPTAAKSHKKMYLFLRRSAQLAQGQKEWALKVSMDFLAFSRTLMVCGLVTFDAEKTLPKYVTRLYKGVQKRNRSDGIFGLDGKWWSTQAGWNTISGDQVFWNDGETSKITQQADGKFATNQQGEAYTFTKEKDGTLRWSDDDVWSDSLEEDVILEVETFLSKRKIGNFRDLPEDKVQKLRDDLVQEWKNRRDRGWEWEMVDEREIAALEDSEELRDVTQKILEELKNIQSEQEQQKQIKKLRIKWHPDKNLEDTENATKVFQWLDKVKDAVNGGRRLS